ncbi:hypothetical protein TWF694_007270 [Orbilia ellipsospora]|uniref:ribonuclease H n=1 Tax=Orbilia ellipsospora TaxID=2528407 RepID=A0AAV9XH83_9PEZI
MVYRMDFKVDGACRGNGRPGAIAAAAACLYTRGNTYYSRTEQLPYDDPVATNDRAELQAIIMALEWALEKYQSLDSCPRLKVTISGDSEHAINSITKWVYKWQENGWYTTAGTPVKNRDLIQEACRLENEIEEIGEVHYEWIPREKNMDADEKCNEALDDFEYPYWA